MATDLTGIVPPVVTPLTEDRQLDIPAYENLIEHLIGGGVHGLFVLGSSSEVVYCTDERRDQILREAIRITAGRVPIIAGVIDTQTPRVIAQAKRAQDLGVDGVVATAPFYSLGAGEVLERHFTALAEAIEVPVWAYDIPVCVHVKLPADLMVKLGSEGIVAGVKDSSGDDVAFRRLALANRKAGSPLRLLTGHEVVVDGAYLSGADGAVPGLGNVDPAGYVRQWEAYQKGDWEAVRAEQDRLTELMNITSVVRGVSGFGAGIGAFKSALHLLGVINNNQMPEPVERLSPENVERVRQVMLGVGFDV